MPTNPDICPVCGGPLFSKQVEKLLRDGVNTAVIQVRAQVCERCGERLYTPETIRHFEEIRNKLAHDETAEFTPLGQSFQAV